MERTWKTSVWLEHWNSLLRDLHDSVSETDGGYVRRHAVSHTPWVPYVETRTVQGYVGDDQGALCNPVPLAFLHGDRTACAPDPAVTDVCLALRRVADVRVRPNERGIRPARKRSNVLRWRTQMNYIGSKLSLLDNIQQVLDQLIYRLRAPPRPVRGHGRLQIPEGTRARGLRQRLATLLE